jgi:putative transposase
VDSLDLAFRAGVRRACSLLEFSRTSYYYRSIKVDDPALRQRIRQIAEVRVRYGYQRIHVLLKREGWQVNHKRVYRIYCEEGLSLRRKRPKRRVSAAHRLKRPQIERADQCWSMDFVADNLFNGRRIRALTVVDNFSRECLAIQVNHSVKADQVVSIMEGLRLFAGRTPQRIQVDNYGPCYLAGELKQYLDQQAISHTRGRPYHPMTQGKIERYHRTLKYVVNLENYYLPWHLEHKIGEFVQYYNHQRVHESLYNLTPADVYHGRYKEIIEARNLVKEQNLRRRRRQNMGLEPLNEEMIKPAILREYVCWQNDQSVPKGLTTYTLK